MRMALTALPAAALVVTLAGCSAAPMNSELLQDWVTAPRVDERAAAHCQFADEETLISAIDSTTAEVLQIGSEVETRGDWASHLPSSPESYAAVCIFDVSALEGPTFEDRDFIALWWAEDDHFSGDSTITMWSRSND